MRDTTFFVLLVYAIELYFGDIYLQKENYFLIMIIPFSCDWNCTKSVLITCKWTIFFVTFLAYLLTWPLQVTQWPVCWAGWQCDQARQTAKSASSMGQVAVGRGYYQSDRGWRENYIANITSITMWGTFICWFIPWDFEVWRHFILKIEWLFKNTLKTESYFLSIVITYIFLNNQNCTKKS